MKDYNVADQMSKSYTLVIDTREKQNPRYFARLKGFQDILDFKGTLERQKLAVGDYSGIAITPSGNVIDYCSLVSVERKMDIEEYLSCCFGQRQRFESELRRAQEMSCKLYVAIESGSYPDLVAGNYKYPVAPKLAVSTYHTFEERYGVHFQFVTPESFPLYAYNTIRRFILEHLMRNFPNGGLI